MKNDFVVFALSSKLSMPPVVESHTVGVVGPDLSRQFVLERLVLRQDFIAAPDHAVDFNEAGSGGDVTGTSSFERQVIDDPRTQIIYFTGPTSFELIFAALQRGKHIVLSPAAATLRADDLRWLARTASDQGLVAVVDEPRRWDDDFRSARNVAQSGRLGDLLRIRLSILTTALPGEEFPRGVLRELGWHWLDQLLTFVNDELLSARLRRFASPATTSDAGFLATMEFARGTSTVIEVQTQSLLSLRTGWLLEGSAGAYRAGRQYTKTLDGEIIDEPLSVDSLTNDPFFDALGLAIRGEEQPEPLPDLVQAARIAELIESLTASEPSKPGL